MGWLRQAYIQGGRLWRLPGAEQRRLLRVWMLVLVVRLALCVLPLRIVRQTLAYVAQPGRRSRGAVPVAHLVWTVRVAAAYVPRASCLTQALALQIVLARHGFPTEIRIGLLKQATGRLAGHAWVECQGAIVLGDDGLDEFTPLAAFEGRLTPR